MSDLIYPLAAPCSHTKAQIFGAAEGFARRIKFLPGDRIEPVVSRLGGKLEYLGSLDSIEAIDGSLFVDGPANFRILISAFTGAERDRFTIAHELGHYVLHSREGQKRIRARRFGSDRVEWEANWFAAAFLMPADDFKHAAKKYKGDPVLLAARYLVSPRAAKVRKSDLNI